VIGGEINLPHLVFGKLLLHKSQARGHIRPNEVIFPASLVTVVLICVHYKLCQKRLGGHLK